MAGYLFFTLISVKEPRHSLMVLLPLAVAAPLFLTAILPKPLGEFAGLALGIGTLLYTLVFCPVPRVEGYQDIALYLAKNVPHDGVVLYSGYRDANLIFDLATRGSGRISPLFAPTSCCCQSRRGSGDVVSRNRTTTQSRSPECCATSGRRIS